jgi:hypothetical protein
MPKKAMQKQIDISINAWYARVHGEERQTGFDR